jgi:hypothetical protein
MSPISLRTAEDGLFKGALACKLMPAPVYFVSMGSTPCGRIWSEISVEATDDSRHQRDVSLCIGLARCQFPEPSRAQLSHLRVLYLHVYPVGRTQQLRDLAAQGCRR